MITELLNGAAGPPFGEATCSAEDAELSTESAPPALWQPLVLVLQRWMGFEVLHEWRPRRAVEQFGDHQRAAIGELIIRSNNETVVLIDALSPRGPGWLPDPKLRQRLGNKILTPLSYTFQRQMTSRASLGLRIASQKSNLPVWLARKLKQTGFWRTWSGDGPSNVSKLIACQRTSDRTICRIWLWRSARLRRTCTRTISRVFDRIWVYVSEDDADNTYFEMRAGNGTVGLLSEH